MTGLKKKTLKQAFYERDAAEIRPILFVDRVKTEEAH